MPETNSPCSEIIDDIEDLISTQDISPKERYSSRKNVKVQVKKKNIHNAPVPVPIGDNIPGTQRIYMKTWGCAHNSSDSEYMAGQLAAYGYQLVEDKTLADLWLLNSCTVKNPSEDHFRYIIFVCYYVYNIVYHGHAVSLHLVEAMSS
nr:unnamed protein product [Callosobruchus analis]